MKFFVQGAEDTASAERVYEATRAYVSRDLDVTLSDKRVYRIHGLHDSKEFDARVGEQFGGQPEPVVAILFDEDRDLYFVCTRNRGVMGGVPYLFEGNEVRSVEEFEEGS